jgi:hypothetical protein
VVNEPFAAAESKRDCGLNETVARAEQQAIGRARERLAAETATFLDPFSARASTSTRPSFSRTISPGPFADGV